MKKHITSLFSILALFASLEISAQSYIGLNTANYSGVVGATIHPASIEDYEGKFDMVFLGINAFADNNYEKAVRDKAFLNFSFTDFDRATVRNDQEKYALLNFEVTLPSFMIKTKKWGTIGMINRVRNYMTANNVSAGFSRALADGFENSQLFDQNFLNQSFDITMLSWDEIGITWAKVIKKNKYKKITLGMTPKILFGNASTFTNFRADTLSNVGIGLVNVGDFNLQYGYSDNLDGVANDDFKWQKGNKFNLGLDIGVEYTHFYKSDYHPSFSKYVKLYRLNNKEKNAYKYKVSLSLLDVGRVKFNHGSYNNRASLTLPNLNTIDVRSLVGTFDDPNALRDSLNSLLVLEQLEGPYTIGLPTTLQMGVDYHIKGGTYINGNLGLNISGVKWSDQKTNDLTSITITPRWENNWIGFHAPIYSNFKGSANLGFGARIGPLAFGISDVLPFVSRKEVSSAGAYLVFRTFVRHKKEKSNTECGSGGEWNRRKKRRKM